MEQIRLGNGNLYELTVNGIVEDVNDKLRVIIVQGINDFTTVENDFEKESNTQRIEILDNAGDVMDVKKGYTHLESIKKQKDYVLERSSVEDEIGTINYEETTETVYILVLSKPDLRKQVENLQETVDMLILSELGE